MKNPYEVAEDVIAEIQGQLSELSLEEAEFPFIENPLLPKVESNPVTGPNTLNLPGIDQKLCHNHKQLSVF